MSYNQWNKRMFKSEQQVGFLKSQLQEKSRRNCKGDLLFTMRITSTRHLPPPCFVLTTLSFPGNKTNQKCFALWPYWSLLQNINSPGVFCSNYGFSCWRKRCHFLHQRCPGVGGDEDSLCHHGLREQSSQCADKRAGGGAEADPDSGGERRRAMGEQWWRQKKQRRLRAPPPSQSTG